VPLLVLKVVVLTLAAATIAFLAAAGTLGTVFWLPVILGQPMQSMVGWGWITFIPAVALGAVAGISVYAYLVRKIVAAGNEETRDTCKMRGTVVIAVTVTIGLIVQINGFMDSAMYLAERCGRLCGA
jgi:hypothetical protein